MTTQTQTNESKFAIGQTVYVMPGRLSATVVERNNSEPCWQYKVDGDSAWISEWRLRSTHEEIEDIQNLDEDQDEDEINYDGYDDDPPLGRNWFLSS